MCKALLACLISAALPLQAKDIEKLAWMSGVWSQTRAGEIVQESWLGPSGKTLVAVNLTTSAQGNTTFEYMRIVETVAGISFIASPGGAAPTEFKLKEMTATRVVFENLSHDFPQRVIYSLASDGALLARIEGTQQGKFEAMDWRFVPADQH